MNKRYILTAKFVDREGKNQTDEQFFSGTEGVARTLAKNLHALLIESGMRYIAPKTLPKMPATIKIMLPLKMVFFIFVSPLE